MVLKKIFKRNAISLITALSIFTTFGVNATLAETGNTSFVAMHGGDTKMDKSDATDFRNAFSNQGWSGYQILQASYNNMRNASGYNVLYWSGHGLSNGVMSYFDDNGVYQSYDNSSNKTPMYDRIGATYKKYSSWSGYYSNSAWNGNLNWVVLAACNQLTESATRNKWAIAMAGKHRVKGLMGYMGTAPGTDKPWKDNDIAKKFADLCFNSDKKRVVYAWIQANNGVWANAAALYHSINENDTLTKITDNPISLRPNYRLMKSDQTVITDPFAANTSLGSTGYATINSSYMNLASAVHGISNLTFSNILDNGLDATIDSLVDDIDSNISTEIVTSDKSTLKLVDEAEVKRAYSHIKYNLKDRKDVEKTITSALKGKEIPDDAELCEMKPIVSEGLDEEGNLIGDKTVEGYILNYGHKVNGVKVASTHYGDYVNVYLDREGIYTVEKKWTNVKAKDLKSTKKLTRKKAIKAADAVKKANRHIRDAYGLDDIKTKAQLSYVEKNSKLVPAWEVTTDNKLGTLYVDASTGEVIN